MTQLDSFDDVTIDQLREVGGVKWSTYPDKIGAFVAEMDFGVADPIVAALHAAVDVGAFGYLPASYVTRMSEAYARWAGTRYGWEVDPADVRPVADVLVAMEATITHFSTPGSAVIVPTPAYMPFLFVPPALGREAVQVPMARDEDRYVYDLDAIDAAFAAGANVLVLCNPHNPVGRVLQRQEMLDLAEVVERHGGRVFSDEIHAPLVFDEHRHVPYASLSEVTAGHTLTATSASKAWNLPGMKTAQLVLSNDADRQRWATVGLMAEHGASNLGVIANTAAYSAGDRWLDRVLAYLDGNRRLLGELLDEHLPGTGYTPPEGTYLAWLDMREHDLGPEVATFFDSRAGVVGVDGNRCGTAGEGFLRYNFATPRPIMEASIAAMGAALRTR